MRKDCDGVRLVTEAFIGKHHFDLLSTTLYFRFQFPPGFASRQHLPSVYRNIIPRYDPQVLPPDMRVALCRSRGSRKLVPTQSHHRIRGCHHIYILVFHHQEHAQKGSSRYHRAHQRYKLSRTQNYYELIIATANAQHLHPQYVNFEIRTKRTPKENHMLRQRRDYDA